jgi:hypothetical protein
MLPSYFVLSQMFVTSLSLELHGSICLFQINFEITHLQMVLPGRPRLKSTFHDYLFLAIL